MAKVRKYDVIIIFPGFFYSTFFLLFKSFFFFFSCSGVATDLLSEHLKDGVVAGHKNLVSN